jgi:hypothetical protein
MIALWQRLFSRKISWDFTVLGKVIRKRLRFRVVDPSEGDGRLAVICLMLIMTKPRLISLSDMSSAGVFCGRWRITAFMAFRIWGRGVVGQVLTVEVGFDGREIIHASREDSGSVSCAMEFNNYKVR